MASKKTENLVVYNKGTDTLFVSQGRASYASIDIDDFIFDFDNRGFLVALEIENVSSNFGITKKKLHIL